MASRATDELVRRWLTWARNYEEIIDFQKIAPRGRCWKITIREGVPRTGSKPLSAISPLFASDDDYVPTELMLTAREAIVFGMACATAGACMDRRAWTQDDWEAQSERHRRAREGMERKP